MQRRNAIFVLHCSLLVLNACGVPDSLTTATGPTTPPFDYPSPATPAPSTDALYPIPPHSEQQSSITVVREIVEDGAVVALIDNLRVQGYVPQIDGASRVEWLSDAPGQAYTLDDGWLYIHRYPTSEAAQAVVARIPPSANTGVIDWVAAPHFFRCDVLIVLYLGNEEGITNALAKSCGPAFAQMEAMSPTIEPVPLFHEKQRAALEPTDLLLQLDSEPTFFRFEAFQPFGRVPQFTLLANGNVFYKDAGSPPSYSNERLMRAALSPDETVALVQQILNLGVTRVTNHEDVCEPSETDQKMCISDASYTLLRIRLPDGVLRETRNYAGFANEPEILKQASEMLSNYRRSDATGYQPEQSTMFIRREQGEPNGVPVVDWPLDADWLTPPRVGVEQWAKVLEGEARDMVFAVVPRTMGDFYFRTEAGFYSVLLVPWLPSADYRSELDSYSFP